MNKRKPKWDILSDKKRQKCINEIITFFEEERDDKIGIVSAEKFLDFFLEMLVEDVYNGAIEDSKKLLKQRFEDLEIDLDLLLNK